MNATAPTRCDSPVARAARRRTLPPVQARASAPSALLVTAVRAFTDVSLENRLLLCLALATFAYCSYQCLQTPEHKAHAARAQISAAAVTASAAPSALTPLPQSPPSPSAAPDAANTVALLQVQAVRALISGHRQEALAVYQQLAAAVPNAPEYRAAAAILSKKIAPLARGERDP